MTDSLRPELSALYERLALTQDKNRAEAASKRHAKGYRTARENLEDLVDPDSFQEYGQLAVAAQRSRRSKEDLQSNTPADGIITGICTINSALVGQQASQAAVIINDYSVLAGTQIALMRQMHPESFTPIATSPSGKTVIYQTRFNATR